MRPSSRSQSAATTALRKVHGELFRVKRLREIPQWCILGRCGVWAPPTVTVRMRCVHARGRQGLSRPPPLGGSPEGGSCHERSYTPPCILTEGRYTADTPQIYLCGFRAEAVYLHTKIHGFQVEAVYLHGARS